MKRLFRFLKKNFFEIKYFFISLDVLTESINKNPKIIFFSENKSYQKYSKILIDTLIDMYPNEIFYLSIDKEDQIFDERIKNFYISPILINFVFNHLKTDNLILTLTDLNNNYLKKSKNIKKYIYYFHSPVSTIKNYTHQAFDNYDTVMCVGQFQIDEIRERENSKKLKKKVLAPTGYFYFDTLLSKINYNSVANEVLIAPSWNKNLKNFINENFIELIDALLNKKYNVTFRPHPEHIKRSKNILGKMKKKFNKNFQIDCTDCNMKSMEKAQCLITDSSGIAIEYMMILKRPVLYLDEYDKIHNEDYHNLSKEKIIDNKIREFGCLFKQKDFYKIDEIIINAQQNFKREQHSFANFIKSHFFNFGSTRDFLNKNVKNYLYTKVD